MLKDLGSARQLSHRKGKLLGLRWWQWFSVPWRWELSAPYHTCHILSGSFDSRPCINGDAIANSLSGRTDTIDIAAFGSRRSHMLQVWHHILIL